MITKNTRSIYLYEKQNKKCFYCGLELSLFENGQIKDVRNCNIDHILPVSKGGKDTIENICLSCVSCNEAKGDMTVEEFTPLLRLILEGKLPKGDMAEYKKYIQLKQKFGSVELN